MLQQDCRHQMFRHWGKSLIVDKWRSQRTSGCGAAIHMPFLVKLTSLQQTHFQLRLLSFKTSSTVPEDVKIAARIYICRHTYYHSTNECNQSFLLKPKKKNKNKKTSPHCYEVIENLVRIILSSTQCSGVHASAYDDYDDECHTHSIRTRACTHSHKREWFGFFHYPLSLASCRHTYTRNSIIVSRKNEKSNNDTIVFLHGKSTAHSYGNIRELV